MITGIFSHLFRNDRLSDLSPECRGDQNMIQSGFRTMIIKCETLGNRFNEPHNVH